MQPKIVISDPNATEILANAWADADALIPSEFLEKATNDYAEELISQIGLRHKINTHGTEIRYNSLVCACFVEENQEQSFQILPFRKILDILQNVLYNYIY